VPLASKDPRFKQICDELHLQPRGADGEHSEANDIGLFDISPLKRLGLTEVDCVKALHAGATRLIALEKELRANPIDVHSYPIAREFPANLPGNSLMKQHLTRGVYESLKDTTTSLGVTLYDIIKLGVQYPNCKLGAIALDHESYTVFSALMDPVIEGYHRGYKLSEGHRRDLDPSHLGEAAENPDPTGEFISSTRIRVARNLRGFPLPGKNTTAQRREIEALVVDALNSLEGELAGTYYSLETMDDATRVRLEQDHFLFRKEVGYFAFGGVYRDWPEGRGIFHNPSKTFLVWVNEEDELRIISMQEGGNIGEVFTRLSNAIQMLESKLDVIFDDQRGFIASCPSNLGTGMRASVHVKVPLASKDPRFKQICDELHLQPRGADGEHSEANDIGLFDISPLKRLGLTEVDCVKALHAGATRLIALEKELRTSV
jgi:protein-arginine kinase